MPSETGKLVAVVDDEKDIRELVELHLQRAGFTCASFETGAGFLRWLSPERIPSLCILDIMLPDIQGTDICRELRASKVFKNIPVIMHETDRVTGLELGADDYMTKPFSPRELVARIRAILRRTREKPSAEAGSIILFCGPVELNTETFRMKVNGVTIELTSTEFRILRILMEGKGKVFPRSKLLDMLWEGEKFVFERTIDVHVVHIREKLGEASGLLQNVRGIGYRLGEPGQ
jgi:DNA-binding response OmpR family regulator